MNPRLSKLWTVQELADFLDVPARTIYAWRSQGYGPKGKKVGRHVRFDPAEVESWFDGLTDEVA
ncbi:AlpA family transcriptional regulator [Actinomycetospora sp. TBRC 11914]|uniref:helix-turn-helix transcriptional regulator n=1 Tax=Actinomycetospora sp. TBRC 11914 TaxID=2729387 RepID=UPI00145E91A6|nr:helix-turn-helix domain-containing protein [Actinomycetospora sp. TBRC 11914]NMO93117.1 helix-turn-helix domain-containing protein [Actinomycetospora sp. TBRC 11914]